MSKTTTSKRFTSRFDYEVNFLAQEWRALRLPEQTGAASFSHLWEVSLASQKLLVAMVQVVADARTSALDIERTTSRLMLDASRTHNPDSSPRWVARQMLLPSPLDPPRDWLQSTGTPIHIVNRSASRQSILLAAWGNGTIDNWDALSEDQQFEICRGLVDAQVIWSDLTIVSDATLQDSSDLFFDGDRKIKPGDLTSKQESTEGAALRIARHNLLRDELYFNIQGLRREVGETLLDAWRHPEAVHRVRRRVDEMSEIVNIRLQERAKRYQSAVESVLLVLGLFTVIDVAIALLSLAFSGADRSPGSGSPLGLLSWIRAANTDLLVLCSVGVVVALTIFIYRRGRR